MYKGKKVSLIFPAYNEEENIVKAIKEFKNLKEIDEIIVVDNNSTDATYLLAKKTGIKLTKEARQGFGYSLQKGISIATGDTIILCEPDGTFDPQDALRLLDLSKNYQVVLGSRTNRAYIHKDANMGFLIRLGNIYVAKILQFFYKTPSLTDCGCTFRVFDSNVLKRILPFFTVGASHFLPETIVLASFTNASIIEIPIYYRKRIGTSKITGSLKKACFVGALMMYTILKYKFNQPIKERVQRLF